MRKAFKRMSLVISAVALLATSSLFASATAAGGTYVSDKASALLAEIKSQGTELAFNAETLGTLAWNPRSSWQNHALYLDRIKGHINTVGEHISELQQIQHGALPWQQQAIDRITAEAAQVAASTQAAIVHLSENQNRLFDSEYRGHLTTIANSSANMKQTVDRFLDYERTDQRLQQLQNELELKS